MEEFYRILGRGVYWYYLGKGSAAITLLVIDRLSRLSEIEEATGEKNVMIKWSFRSRLLEIEEATGKEATDDIFEDEDGK